MLDFRNFTAQGSPGTDHRVPGTDQRAYIGRVTVAFPGMADEDTNLVGREEELSRLRGLVASPYTESRVLLLLGDPGVGKPKGGPGGTWAHLRPDPGPGRGDDLGDA